QPTAGVIDQDAAHGLGSGGEEVAAAVEPLLVADEPQVGLVDQGGGAEGVAGRFAGHPRCREPAQLVVDEREQGGGRPAVPGRGVLEGAGGVAPAAICPRRGTANNSKATRWRCATRTALTVARVGVPDRTAPSWLPLRLHPWASPGEWGYSVGTSFFQV